MLKRDEGVMESEVEICLTDFCPLLSDRLGPRQHEQSTTINNNAIE